jgi:hypothetical protein
MPRTAPTYTGTPTYVVVSFRFIDANGDKTSSSYITTSARATVAAIEAMAAALAAASNANLYDIVVESHDDGSPSSSSATDALRESANDVIITLVRDPASRKTQEVEIPAPLETLFIAGGNKVDTTDTLYQAVNTAADTLLPAAYVFISTRFSQHRKLSEKTVF